MTPEGKWWRVNREFKCGICEHSDWCTIGEKGFCCMRIANAHPLKNGGWFHRFTDAKPALPVVAKEPPRINSTALIRDWSDRTKGEWLDEFGASLGVSLDSLRALNCAWAFPHRAWAFPMRNGYGSPVGIRLRFEDGRKLAVTGSRQGIFIPEMEPQETAYLTEGPTDTAAALTIGLFAIGRPSCSGGTEEIKTALKRFGVRQVVIVSDNDGPGLQGAERLNLDLIGHTCIWIPPAKDMREFVNQGGTKALIESLTRNLVWKSLP